MEGEVFWVWKGYHDPLVCWVIGATCLIGLIVFTFCRFRNHRNGI